MTLICISEHQQCIALQNVGLTQNKQWCSFSLLSEKTWGPPVNLFIYIIMWQFLISCRYWLGSSVNAHIEQKKNNVLSDFHSGVIISRWTGPSISETADPLGCTSTTVSRVFTQIGSKEKQNKNYPVSCRRKCLVDDWGQTRMARLELITASLQLWWTEKHLRMHNNSGALRQMGSNTRSTMGFIPSAKNRNPRLCVDTGLQKLSSLRLKKLWLVWMWISAEARRDWRIRIWHQQHKSMDSSCLVSTVHRLLVL